MGHFELYVLGFLGVAIHYLKGWAEANKRNQQYNLVKAVPFMLLSLITTLLLVYLRDDIAPLYVVTPFSAVVLGYVGNSAFFSFVNARKPKLNEKE